MDMFRVWDLHELLFFKIPCMYTILMLSVVSLFDIFVVVKIMVPNIVGNLLFRVPKKGP